MTSHAGQKKISLTITHEAATRIKALVANVRHGLRLIQETAPQLDSHQRWFALLRYLVERLLAPYWSLWAQTESGIARLRDWVTEVNRIIRTCQREPRRFLILRLEPCLFSSQIE